MSQVKVYLNSYPIYTMLNRGSTADLIYSEVVCHSGIIVSKLLYSLVDIKEK